MVERGQELERLGLDRLVTDMAVEQFASSDWESGVEALIVGAAGLEAWIRVDSRGKGVEKRVENYR